MNETEKERFVNVFVTTEMGNVFASETNTLDLNQPTGILPTNLVVFIETQNLGGRRKWYKVEVIYNGTDPTFSWSTSVEISSVGFAPPTSISLPRNGCYILNVYNRIGGSYGDPYYSERVAVSGFRWVSVLGE